MRAVVVEKCGTSGGMDLKEVDVLGILAGQVRVAVQATIIGFVDTLRVQGLYQTNDPLPFAPGASLLAWLMPWHRISRALNPAHESWVRFGLHQVPKTPS